jgi:pimeloyl-ACP methyl ester carboxylesterase
MDREQAIIAQFESANPDQLTELLRSATGEQEKVLRLHLGDDHFRSLRDVATPAGARRGDKRRRNVVVLPGIMGSELTAYQGGAGTLVWLSLVRIAFGWLPRLRLAEDGLNPFDAAAGYSARATGILNKYYGKILVKLNASWNVRPFWYDWRKNLDVAAAELGAFLEAQFPTDEPVHIVAHSMGGLVARTWLRRQQLAGNDIHAALHGGKLIMLGTPNFGSFEVPQIFTGIQDTVRSLTKLAGAGRLTFFELAKVRADLLDVLDSFPGVYQMMPWPDALDGQPNIEELYKATTFANFGAGVSQVHLQAAREHHAWLNGTFSPGLFPL